jgi:hypothetical protein
MTITIFVKPTATGDKITLTDIDEEMLVSDLKDAIAQHSPILAAEQRVIYKGQILKNERTVASYGKFEDLLKDLLFLTPLIHRHR